MIVRIMGEGQVELADSHVVELNKLDDILLAEMESGDGPGFRTTLHLDTQRDRPGDRARREDVREEEEGGPLLLRDQRLGTSTQPFVTAA